MKNSSTTLSFETAKKKIEHYCAYQERCHQEVQTKLKSYQLNAEEIDLITVHLIQENFLNEERFARSYARGKHRISSWGRNRIIAELKFRQISAYNIKSALTEIDDEMYCDTLNKISLTKWNSISEPKLHLKKQKAIAALIRKGYEMDLVLDRIEWIAVHS